MIDNIVSEYNAQLFESIEEINEMKIEHFNSELFEIMWYYLTHDLNKAKKMIEMGYDVNKVSREKTVDNLLLNSIIYGDINTVNFLIDNGIKLDLEYDNELGKGNMREFILKYDFNNENSMKCIERIREINCS